MNLQTQNYYNISSDSLTILKEPRKNIIKSRKRYFRELSHTTVSQSQTKLQEIRFLIVFGDATEPFARLKSAKISQKSRKRVFCDISRTSVSFLQTGLEMTKFLIVFESENGRFVII